MKIRNKVKLLSFILPLGMAVPSFAMQPLDDQSLSSTTGQDGISIGIGVDKIEFKQLALIDNSGIKETIIGENFNTAAGVVIAGTNSSPVNVQFVGKPAGASTVNVKIDTDGGNGKPFANIGVKLSDQINGLKISPFAMYLASSNAISTSNESKSIYNVQGQLVSGVSKILEIGSASQNFEITLNKSKSPQVNIQLGNVPQGFMMQFGGAIQAICGTGSGCPIAFVSGNSSAKFDFQAKATDQTNGFSLNGFYGGISKSGLFIGNSGQSSKMNIGLNNVTLGRSGSSSANVFNGLQNSSMGNFGVTGVSVKDLKVNINGL